ncbi:MAG: hypothetical protein AAFV43_12550 [Planctomycetota bacterium]
MAVLTLTGGGLGSLYAQPAAESVATPTALVNRSITELGVEIAPSDGVFPTDYAVARHEETGHEEIGHTTSDAMTEGAVASRPLAAAYRGWPLFARSWTPACTAHRPLYFEEVNAERYGYAYAPCLQPAVSAAHFFGSAVALPYRLGAEPPCECVYTLGHYRPGDCAPYRAQRWPASARGAGWQAATVVGLIALVP